VWAEKARKIEALGYATLNVPDHLADLLAPIPALISAARRQSTFGSPPTSSTMTFAIQSWWRTKPRRWIS
jgi:hypothetical protein